MVGDRHVKRRTGEHNPTRGVDIALCGSDAATGVIVDEYQCRGIVVESELHHPPRVDDNAVLAALLKTDHAVG